MSSSHQAASLSPKSLITTYSNQQKLQKLPIPALISTLEKYVKTVQPLQGTQEHKLTCAESVEFGKPGGVGEKLQALLIEYASNKDSYIEEFWSASYLTPRDSPVLNLNPFFLLEDAPDPKTSSQLRRASSLVFSSLKFASILRLEKLTPETIKGTPICMAQFHHIFGSARIPQKNQKDYVSSDPNSSHIAVLACNQLYYFRVLHADGAVGISEIEINDILTAILTDAKSSDKKVSGKKAIGVLTTLDRNKWASTREDLIIHSKHNASALSILDSALFVLVLDDFVPKDLNSAAANCLHGTYDLVSDLVNNTEYQNGTCVNRWYDKLQLIVCTDGSAGVNFEHSAVDGHTALRFVSDIFADTVVRFAKSITRTIYSGDHIPDHLDAVVRTGGDEMDGTGTDFRPKRLEFDIPSRVLSSIYYAETALGDQLLQSDVFVLEFEDYGKVFITENNMSPDSFVQMSMILAHYQLYGEFVCAYEPVMTKWFLHGRTEAMRSATAKAKTFCEQWTNPMVKAKDKLIALRAAIEEHSSLVRETAKGLGVDRHLYALKCIADKNGIPIPRFFTDDGYNQLNHTVLSTSNCGNASLRLFGFGPVTPDGFGIGYIIRDTGLQFTITSKHRQTARYANSLRQYLNVVKSMCVKRQSVTVKKHRDSIVSINRTALPVVKSTAAAQAAVLTPSTRRPSYGANVVGNGKHVHIQDEDEGGYADIYGETIIMDTTMMMARVHLRKSVDYKTFEASGIALALVKERESEAGGGANESISD